jgi:hypothetical protein
MEHRAQVKHVMNDGGSSNVFGIVIVAIISKYFDGDEIIVFD